MKIVQRKNNKNGGSMLKGWALQLRNPHARRLGTFQIVQAQQSNEDRSTVQFGCSDLHRICVHEESSTFSCLLRAFYFYSSSL